MNCRIIVLVTVGLFAAGCAYTPDGIPREDLISTAVAAPAPAPEPAPGEGDEEALVVLVDGETGDDTANEEALTEVEVSGTGRGAVVPESREIELGEIVTGGSGGGAASAASGFVYPSVGSAFAATRPETPYVMEAGGETPYWRSQSSFYELDGIVFAEFSLIAVDREPILATLRQVPEAAAPGFRRYVSVEGAPVSAAYQAGPCGAGDGIQRGYFASIRVGDEGFEGCARETGGQWDWSRDLLTRYDAIMLCLDEVPDAVGAVDAYSPSETNTAVRVLRSDQSRIECVIVNEDLRMASVRELDVTEVHLNEGRTVFLREIGETRDECRSYENIFGPDGRLMGVLAHDLCQNPRAHFQGPPPDPES
ncbi:hypothetical protein [Hyphobacterium sp.]|uniref:hypothetical protein n=1 Tax=Hyphobacterium sp. TaxID=2004662 RepID=UPI003BAD5EE7